MITTTRHDDVTVLTIEHGPVNAFDIDLWLALRAAVGDVPETDAMVLTGAGRAFSAGVDLVRQAASTDTEIAAYLNAMATTVTELFLHPRPVIAALNGHAIGAGALLAFAADERLMSAGRIGLPEFQVGVPVPPAVLEVARYTAGRALQHLVMTSALLEPEAAHDLGLIDAVVPADELLQTAIDRAGALARIPHGTYTHTKMLWREPTAERIQQVARHDEATLRLWTSPEVRSAIQARVDSMRS